MNDVRPCLIIVESVQGPVTGLADDITYTVAIAFEDGGRVGGIAGVVPDWPRWAAPIQIDAAAVGSRHPGFVRGQAVGGPEVLSAWILELPHTEPCK